MLYIPDGKNETLHPQSAADGDETHIEGLT